MISWKPGASDTMLRNMTTPLLFGLAVTLAYAGALFWGGLGRAASSGARRASWIGAAAIVLAPLVIPPPAVLWRAIALCACVEVLFKGLEDRRRRRTQGDPHSPDKSEDFLRYCRFLIPFPPYLLTWGRRERRLSVRPAWSTTLLRFGLGGGMIAAGFAGLDLRTRYGLDAGRFWLDHLIVVALFVLTIEGFSLALVALEHAAGFDTDPSMRSILLSRTPADFWRRYNTRVHRWLRDNVFLPSGGTRHPARGVVATYLFSAFFHEAAFAIATSRLDGRQFAFFLLQIPAVLLSPHLERFARRHGPVGRVTIHGLTVLWFTLTSVLFFHGVGRIFPFVYARPPG